MFSFYSFLIVIFTITNTNCYIFSVIMAIYNTEKYLNESIASLLNQSIGYSEIQIILINDGSTDNSEDICLKYQKDYPENVIYLKTNHSGVSEARNIGMSFARGDFINFLDSDDIWDYEAFQYILSFFEQNKDVNIVSGRLKFFGVRNDYHALDYKYYKTRIVNLIKEYNCIQTTASNCFIRASSLLGKKFKKGVLSGEDTRFINKILLTNPIIGIIREAIYYYRKREDYTSRIQTQKKDISYYFYTINYVSQYLIESSIALYNKILPFIQFYLGYDLLFRVKTLSYKYLNKHDYKRYCRIIEEILKSIKDKYILEQTNVENKFKILALSKKYNRDLRYDLTFKNESLFYSNYSLINFSQERNILVWKIFSIEDNILHIEGIDNLWIPKDKYEYYCKLGENKFYPYYKNYSNEDFNSLFGVIDKGRIAIFDIKLEILEKQNLFFYISYMNNICEIFPITGFFTRIPSVKYSYYVYGNYIIKLVDKRLVLFTYDEQLEQSFELQYHNYLKKEGKDDIIKLRNEIKIYNKRAKSKKYKKEIWILNDRKDRAGDNGEFFFRYLRNNKRDYIDAYFAIQKNCTDYFRLYKFGNILDLDSEDYKKMFLKADKIISSITNFFLDNPFGNNQKYLRDLYRFDLIFIENGIIKDDKSKFLNKQSRNIKLFVTSTEKEYKYIISSDYGYNKNNIILTGLPRYDNLEHFRHLVGSENNKIILVIPTWRMNIKENMGSPLYETIHSEDFKYTKYFNFYNNLINDEKLINAMKLYNYKGIFCLHQNFAAQWIDFTKNEVFKIEGICNYQELIMKSSLLITDYSSIFFDFGYLKKPIIYTHFDYKEYRLSQYPEGYFNYKKDGFGPIYKSINNTVNAIIKSIETNCTIKEKYLKRINEFFTFFDENNNERLFKEITKDEYFAFKDFKYRQIYITIIFILLIILKYINFINNIF